MSSDWEEIKRLASDLQKIQLSSSVQKLSERNCVEVVTLLIEKKLIDVIYTLDGKEYLTFTHLTSEVQEELYLSGGRVNLVDIARSLNVDLNHVKRSAKILTKPENNVHFVLGQMIDESYVVRIASEINEKLQQYGELSTAELAMQFDLPTNFMLHHVIDKYLGTIVMGEQHPTNPLIIFTKTHVARCKAKLRGALRAITRPTTIASIIAQCGIKERMFNSLMSDMSSLGHVTSLQAGGTYIPNLFTTMQLDWVKSNLKQNGYLEFENLLKIGITDPLGYIQRQLPNETLVHLVNCCVSPQIIEQLEISLEECIETGSFLDVLTIMPSVFTEEDIAKILTLVIDSAKQKNIQLFETTIVTKKYLDDLLKPCYELVNQNVKESIDSGVYQRFMAEKQLNLQKSGDTGNYVDTKSDRRDERRRKAASGKGGGGTQGRETKTKSTKKHQRGKANDFSDSDDDGSAVQTKKLTEQTFTFITADEMKTAIRRTLEKDGLDEICTDLVDKHQPEINKTGLAAAQALYISSLQNSAQSRKKAHAELEEKLNSLLSYIRLYEKGLRILPIDMQSQLEKYLIKSLCTDFCNEVNLFVASECNLNFNSSLLNNEQRNKIVMECGNSFKPSLTVLNKSIAGSTIDEFLENSDLGFKVCSMSVRKSDKRKDRTFVFSHKQQLLEEMSNCKDEALLLHLAVLIVFITTTQSIIHTSGRHVSGVLTFLQTKIDNADFQTFKEYHDLVLQLLSAKTTEDGNKVHERLNALENVVRDIVLKLNKNTAATVAATSSDL